MGLLPKPKRTAANYRDYPAGTLRRILTFQEREDGNDEGDSVIFGGAAEPPLRGR
jgi:hypothetical protein